MSRAARALLIAVIAGAVLIIVSLVGFVLWSRANSQTVLGAVTVAGIELRGVERTEAEALLAGLESEQAAATIQIFVDDQPFTVSAAEFGYRINTRELVDLALWQERDGSFVTRWRRWLRNFYSDPDPVELHPWSSVDETLVKNLLDQLDRQYGTPPVEGSVELVNGRPVATYPAPGWILDTGDAVERIAAAAAGGGGTVRLNTALVEPRTGIEQVADALAQARTWVSAPVVLEDPAGETDLVFTAEEIAGATDLRFDADASPAVSLRVDPRLVTRKVAEISDRVGDRPVNAYYEIDEEDRVIIHPSAPGTVIDVARTGELLEELAAGQARRGALPIMVGIQPQVTTGDIEMLGIRHLVSQYTTYHPCCAPRVNNIQLFADKISDALVPPGERFSLNRHVGRRTEADGFVEAGTLVRGELVDTIGGGVSQFATTFYNAVFWGGYENITHKTHSFYFPRYPEGIEATINWPEVDLVFRNDSAGHVLIRTEHTGASITVKFFGDNDGRILVGSWRDGEGRLEVVAEGGPDARLVSATVSERFDELAPPDTLYRANPELAAGEVESVQTAAPGWTVTVTRTITQRGESTRHVRDVRYVPRQEIIEVHPCVMGLLTETGAWTPPEPSATGDEDTDGEEPVVCPGPEDEDAPELPEGLYDRFPELVPEEDGQTPIEDGDGEQTPIGDDEGNASGGREDPDPADDTNP